MKKVPDNQIAFYQSQDGSVNIYLEDEINQNVACKDFLQVQLPRISR